MMNGSNRGDTNYDAVTAPNPNMDKLSPAEVAKLKNLFEVLFTADTGYIKDNMDVLPIALSGPNLHDPSGQTVTIPSTSAPGSPSSGSVTSDQDITGKGSVQ